MRLSNQIRYFFFFYLIVWLSPVRLIAAEEPYSNSIKGTIKKGDTLWVKDEKFRNAQYDWSRIQKQEVSNFISLRFSNDSTKIPPPSFYVEVTLKIEYFTSPEQPQPLEKKDVKLRIQYNQDTVQLRKMLDYYKFGQAHWVRVEVEEVKSDVFGSLGSFVELEAQVIIDRKYRSEPGRNSTPTIQLIKEKDPVSGARQQKSSMQFMAMQTNSGGISENGTVLQVSIPMEEVGEEFDVEWTPLERTASNAAWIDQLLANNNAAKPELVKHFWNNASRQTLRTTRTARITLAYRQQYVCVRTRSVTYDLDGIRLEGEWDYNVMEDGNSRLAIFELFTSDPILDKSFESQINWQYTGSFSDDGRKKEIITYFDGALRNRQILTQTYDGEEPTTIVGESLMDPVGRNVLNFLPVPIPSTNLRFKKNAFGDDLRFNSSFLHTEGSFVKPKFNALPVSLNNPASTYYSSQNNWIGEGNNGYIPNAAGFPFTVTGYSSDPTGLVRYQGGLGSVLQPINSHTNNRTTRFYYAKPTQSELNMFFGNEIGYAEHYQKIATVDPNGQISLAWKNLTGKTIATALTGAVPNNIGIINGAITLNAKSLILKPSDFVSDRGSRTLKGVASHFVASSGPAKLTLDFNQLIHQYTNGNIQICTGCRYNVIIKVADEYGTPAKDLISNQDKEIFQLLIANGSCSVSGLINKEFNYNFPGIGEYMFQIELSISNDIIDTQTDYYLNERTLNEDLYSRSYFLKNEINTLNLDDCYSDCSTCIVDLGKKEDFVESLLSTIQKNYDVGELSPADIDELTAQLNTKYDDLLNACNSKQSNCVNNACEVFSSLMLQDVSPGGQFALYNSQDPNLTLLEPHLNVLGLHFRTVFPVLISSHEEYMATSFELPDGSLTSPHDANFTTKQLIQYWKEDWAYKFLPYHPEYCKLQFCESNNQYYVWDNQIAEEIRSLDQIGTHRLTSGMSYTNSEPNWLLDIDPFFATNGPGFTRKSTMQNLLLSFSSEVLGLTAVTNKNINQYIDYLLYCSSPGSTTSEGDPTWNNCEVVSSCRVPNEEWRMFVEYYFQAKQKIYELIQLEEGCLGSCAVGKPINISFDGCPSVLQIEVKDDPSGTCSSGFQAIKIVLPGKSNGTTNILLKYPAAYATGLPESITFNNGQQELQLCIPSEMPVSAVVVDGIQCTLSSLPVDNCPFGTGGTLLLSANAKQETSSRFSVIDNTTGQKTTYLLIKGRADQQPSTAGLCNGTLQGSPAFFACYKVKIGGKLVATYSDVWVITCTEDLCASASVLNMELQLGTNKYSAGGYVYYVQPNGTSTPNPECTSPLLLYTQTCVKVKVGTGSAVNVYNATVYRCESCNVNSASISVNSQTSSSPLTFAASNGTYFVYPNVSAGQNITAPACSETITSNWTNCLTVTLGGNSTTYNNVRYFFCPASNCPNSTNFYFNNQLSNYEFQQIQQFDMCTNYITTYTIYTGYTAGNQPPYSPCGNFGVAEYIWYACLQLEDNFGQTYRFSNVWLRTCSDFFNTCGGFNSTLSSSEVSEARNIIDTSSQNFNKKVDAIKKYAEKRGNYRLIKNYYDGTIAIIRKTKKIDTIKKGIDSIPGFSPFIYKQSIYIPIDSLRGEQLNNVEMATLLPTGGTEFQPFVVLPNCPPEFEGGVANVELSPCIGGTGNDHIGWSVVLDNPATEDIPYMIDVVLADQFGTQFIYSIYGTVLNGNISDVVLPCQGGAYISNADQVISWCISISIPEPPGAGCPPEYAHKTSRFPSVDISGNVNIDEIMARKLEEVKGTIASACEGSVEQLLLKLRPFLIANIPSTETNLTTHATYLRIKSRLIDICKAGGDLDHPFGASTTRPGMTANGFTTFQEVLAAEFPLTLEYNPWLIGGPLPWGKKQQVVATTSNRTNESICNKLAAAQSAATAAGKTVFQYLVDTYGAGTVTITSEELTQLQQGCTNCRFLLDEPVTLPVFLDTQNEGCISRSAFNDAKSTFSSLLGTDVNNANYADVYRNFMNSRFGLVLAESDYNTFETSSDGYLCNQVFPDPIPADPFACANEMMGTAIINAKRAYEDYLVLIKRQFQQEYVTNCMNIQPLANLEKSESYNAITLYLYDNAGNLVETVAPREFRRIGETVFPTVDAVRNGLAGNRSLAPHIQTTRYYFNSLNQVIGQYTPDADSSSFWYDTKGRLFASQNKEQRTPTDIDGTTLPSNRYSYTKYDGLGRIIEVGEQSGTNMASILNNSFVQEVGITDFFTGGIKKSITKTYYDEESSISSHPGFIELQGKLDHLRKRVVSSTYQEDEISPIEQATYYSYDLMGNVKSIWQQVSGLSELKKTDYQFDLASGKTTAVLYQDGKSDAFYHQYEYDGENRIKSVYTNTQKAVSAGLLSIINTPGTKKDASYQYYLHGPLSRTELGGNLQGMDYSYTIHGWLKAMNGQDLNPLREMGRDGESGSGIHAGFSRDVLAYSLGYYIDDYAPINGSTYIRSYSYFGVAALRGISLFNGLINYSTVANKGLGDGPTIMAGIYSYHQLYTLAHRDTRIIPAGTTSWSDKVGASYKYCERFGKDINGNLLTIIRSGDQNVDQYKMDDLRLIYDGNRLVQVKELYTNSGLYSNDIEHQEINNYSYDKIGNLISDVQEGITGIFWNVYGKIREIRKGSTVIKYRYDAAGNRVYKEEVGPGVNTATWYVRDAQGNTLATYEGVATPTIKESYIYGASRLGSYSWNIGVGTPARTYEISNYLGNVMATIGDGQIPRMNGSLIEYYDADIKTATDYYSYGMVMPGRSFNSGTYRYGFNGQENDNEVKGWNNQIAYENRIYDPRLGRWHSLDPLAKKYPGESHYAFVSNNPIVFADSKGLDKIAMITIIGRDGTRIQIRSVNVNESLYYHDNSYVGFGYFMKADIIQNITIDLNKDITQQISYSYEVTNRREISIFEYTGQKLTNKFGAIAGYNKNGTKKFGYRIIGNNNNNPNWDNGLPTANTTEGLNLSKWLDFVGGLRAAETTYDLWQKTSNFLRQNGVKISNDARQIEEAGSYIANMSSNLIDAVNIVAGVRERIMAEDDYERIATPVVVYDLPAGTKPYTDTPSIYKKPNPKSPSKDSTIRQPVRHENKKSKNN